MTFLQTLCVLLAIYVIGRELLRRAGNKLLRWIVDKAWEDLMLTQDLPRNATMCGVDPQYHGIVAELDKAPVSKTGVTEKS